MLFLTDKTTLLLSDFLINGTAEDFGNEFEDQLTSTFGCQGLVPYNCYSGNSENYQHDHHYFRS